MDVLTLLVSAVVGVGVGVLSGMLGVGGGMVMVPLFRLGFAMQAIQATATSLVAIIPTSVAGLVRHIRARTCIPSLGIAAGAAGALTSSVGVYLATLSPGWVIMLATAAAIAYTAISMLHSARNLPRSSNPQPANDNTRAAEPGEPGEGATTGPSVEPQVAGRTYLLVVLVGLVAGVLAGFVGLGGGFIIIPLFVNVLGLPMKKASGTSLASVCILALPGAIQQIMLGNAQVGIALAMACGSIPGAILGADLVKRLPERTLRLAFGALLLLAAVLLVVNELTF